MKALLLLAAASLATTGCAAPETPAPPPAGPEGTPPAAAAPVPDAPAGPATAPATGPEMPAPAALAVGDRWFVAVKGTIGSEPFAERSRRRAGEGFVHEELRWGRSFTEVANAEHGIAQVFALFLGPNGLSVSQVDEAYHPAGEARLEVAAPFRPGTAWTVRDERGHEIAARIVAIEKVETPGGTVEALRVEARTSPPRSHVMTTWYDSGLRPVRSEIRSLEEDRVVEASAALASASPTPEDCRAAVEWAKKRLAGEGR